MAFGLNRSVRGVGGDHGVGAGAVGGPQDRPEVAGLLDALDDDDERLRGEAAISASSASTGIADDRDDAVRPVAERELADDGLGHRGEPGRRRQPADRLARLGGPDELVADERLGDLDAGVEGPQQLARPVDDRAGPSRRARAGRAAGPPP